jgi:hypothetical protein
MAKTREEFEAEYNGGVIMPLLLDGRLSIECRCDWEKCHGWKMSHLDHLEDDVDLYGNTSSEIESAIAHRLEVLSKANLEEKI